MRAIYASMGLTIGMAIAPMSAMQISTLATAAVEGPVRALATTFQQQTGDNVKLQFDTSPSIARRLAAGESADVLIATTATVDQAVKDGKAIAETRANIGKVGIGVAVSHGGRRPDISSAEGLKTSLRQADVVLYSQGASGAVVQKMLHDIGVADELASKVVVLPSGGDLMRRLGTAKGTEIGFTMVSEIKAGESHGGSLVGPLPDAIQSYTAFTAVVMSNSTAKQPALAFIRALTSPAARQMLTASGWQF